MLSRTASLRAVTSVLRQNVASMSTVSYAAHGDPTKVLKVTGDEPVGTLGAKQVAIKMLAAPINPADINMVQGNYGMLPKLPAVAGNEGVGVVVATGSGVSGLKVNDKVIPAKAGFGTWRSTAVTDESSLHKVSDKLSVESAATLAVNPSAAYRMLKDFVNLKKGDVVVQNGANSAVGQAVVQLCREWGIKTISIVPRRVGFEAAVQHLQGLGGDVVVPEDYMNTPEFKRLVSDLPAPKLGLNCMGGRSATNVARALGQDATIVTYGGMTRQPVEITTSSLIFKNLSVRGFWLSQWVEKAGAGEREAMLEELSKLAIDGKLLSFVERHPFSQFEFALSKSGEPYNNRKVLLDMSLEK